MVVNRWLRTAIAILPVVFIANSALGYGDTTQTVIMNNETGREVQYEFTDEGDHNVVWPGGTQAFQLSPHEEATRSLNCIQGQKICYGAWVKGDSNLFWGVGGDINNACKGCCFKCVGDSIQFDLGE